MQDHSDMCILKLSYFNSHQQSTSMDSNTFVEILKQGFRTTVGATTSAVETLQDEQKRNEFLSELNTQWTEKSQEWAEKGTLTEQEARRIIEQFFQQKGNQSDNQSSYGENVGSNNSANSNYSDDIRELTQEIINLREELKKINNSNN